jgi:hypothetical protein
MLQFLEKLTKSRSFSKVFNTHYSTLLMIAPHYFRALELIEDCALYSHVFTLSQRPSMSESSELDKKVLSIEGIVHPNHLPIESVGAGRLVNFISQHPIAELLQLDRSHQLPWIIAGLAPWRGFVHPNPPRKEPRFLSSLITKHELMCGEDIRNVIEDMFEKGKLDMAKEVVENHQLNPISRTNAGVSNLIQQLIYFVVDIIRILGQNWRMIIFTSLLYGLIPFTMACIYYPMISEI